ncbi:MAG: GHKL domain-containing protein [Bacteroidales bacterium]|jgi:two-component system phosphate regulon sensor histidine kinase PhoR|nr:GHKL domain-containing protein [Bacteroidales bacterium]
MKLNFRLGITSNKIAGIASIIVCLSTIGLIIILRPALWQSWLTPVVVAGQFLLFFFVFRFLVNLFVEDRIKLIYKSIYTKKKARNDFYKKHRQIGLSGIEQEVQHWLQKHEVKLEQMKQQEAYRRDFLGNVSHELKTPIFNIQGYITTLLDGAIDDPSVNRNYLERTEVSIERMISTITDLEIISRLENQHIQPQCTNFDLTALINEVFNDFEIKAKDYGVNLLLRNKTHFTPMVYADNGQIKQVITNLVENAIRYRHENEPYIKITIYDMHEKIFVEVSDNGIGVAENDIPRLFERFYRTDKARSREHGGSGLGLAIVKHIIEAHNQNITIRSTLGEGTTFSFTLDKSK